ncbi:YdaS family helix-turn-helix protein [Morganella sp. GD04133]|uniref:transcriptional regulator n=1 Tax=Morganella sp. GD04133 TaxID=2975435 RepID=UPI00244C0E6C|nr:YdaS family helix-turn-helix protein [Morganella sp. GD04133]MDH0357030.1 helix-turn-helix domain-containing protein [Morganella sp. GD04133]
MRAEIKQKITSTLSQAEIGRKLGCAQQTVFHWLNYRVPAGRVIPLCELMNWQITPHDLRPDLYPHPTDGTGNQ